MTVPVSSITPTSTAATTTDVWRSAAARRRLNLEEGKRQNSGAVQSGWAPASVQSAVNRPWSSAAEDGARQAAALLLESQVFFFFLSLFSAPLSKHQQHV